MNKLEKCGANYVPLTPLTFLKRAALSYSNRTSIIYQGTHFTWRQTYDRCCRLASALRYSLSIAKNDVVSVLAPNIPAMYEMHFAVPMSGAVLNAINSRLDANAIAVILRHSEPKLFFVDYQYVSVASEALRILVTMNVVNLPLVVVIDDIDSPTGVRLGELEYEQLISNRGTHYKDNDEDDDYMVVADEWDPIALNYTSGTTSSPKGVVYSHRGAYLSTLSLLLGWEMGSEPVYLWSLPMFHCNGWTFPWGIAARGGTNVCIRNTTAYDMYRSIALHKVTHMCCAPIVFNILLEALDDPSSTSKTQTRINHYHRVNVLTGGAPPPAPLLEKMEELGFNVTHAYGLTEATGPALVCEWQAKWNKLSREEQSRLKARQGISILTLADTDVKDLKTMRSVPRDGKTMGEIMLRGSSIMKGYYKDQEATSKAFKDGWFATGDVGVIHPDGFMEIKDRSKDVIISGGENISSVELESVLYRHPRILEAAVVAMPHPRWGETPCAFVTLKKTLILKSETTLVLKMDILTHCRKNLPKFMVPKKIEFVEELPKTSTGKIQKFQLRSVAKTLKISDHDELMSNQKSTPRDQTIALSRL